jgi:lipid-A-disaccharide synthase
MSTNEVESSQEAIGQRLFFSVGEPSGDLHASHLMGCMKKHSSRASFRGFGGTRMIQAGLDLDFDLTTMAVMGIAEVLPKLRQFFRLADMAEDVFRRGEVDGVVLVDFPGFNWHIAKRAKKYGIPVFYYLPPQLWAWGGWRVKKMERWVDHVLCNLPFEKAWFESHGVKSTYVGHPFFDAVARTPLDMQFMHRWRNPQRLQVAILPGSRNHEVHHNWPLQLRVLRQLAVQIPDVEFLVATLKESHAVLCRSLLSNADNRLPLHIFTGKTSEILELSDCTLMKSGSVSLEVMARGKPAAVMYHVSHSTYAMAKLLVHCKSISLPNLIADAMIMPEFISHGSIDSWSAQKSLHGIIEEMSRLLGDSSYRNHKRDELQRLALQYARPGASEMASEWILSHLPDAHGLSRSESLVPTRAVAISKRAA